MRMDPQGKKEMERSNKEEKKDKRDNFYGEFAGTGSPKS